MGPLSTKLLSPVKKSSHLNQEKSAQIKHSLKVKIVQNRSKQTCGWILMWEDKRADFFTGGSVIMNYGLILARSSSLKLKCLNDGLVSYKLTSFSLHKTLIDGLQWCGLLVDYCDVFIRCLDSHSDGTHLLQRIHCWASDVMVHFCKSILMKKQTHLA